MILNHNNHFRSILYPSLHYTLTSLPPKNYINMLCWSIHNHGQITNFQTKFPSTKLFSSTPIAILFRKWQKTYNFFAIYIRVCNTFSWIGVSKSLIRPEPFSMHVLMSSPWWYMHLLLVHRQSNRIAHHSYDFFELDDFADCNLRENIEQWNVIFSWPCYLEFSCYQYVNHVAGPIYININVFVTPRWNLAIPFPFWSAESYIFICNLFKHRQIT